MRDERQLAEDAACAGHSHPEWWTEDPTTTTAGQPTVEAAAALDVCAGCGVREDCLAVAMRYERTQGRTRSGVWGGLLPLQRWRLHRGRRTA